MQGNMPPYGQNNPQGPYYQQPGYGPAPAYGAGQGQGFGAGYPGQSVHSAPYGVHPTLGIPYSEKTKIAAGLLQIFLGGFGVGRFYTGHTALAVAQLLTCFLVGIIGGVLTCGASSVVFLWPFIDGIVLLASDSRDSEGRLLR